MEFCDFVGANREMLTCFVSVLLFMGWFLTFSLLKVKENLNSPALGAGWLFIDMHLVRTCAEEATIFVCPAVT